MVHTFQCLGVNIAVDVNSGAVHVLDELTYHLLEQVQPPMGEHCPAELCARLPQYDPAAMEEAWQELRGLAAEGLLFEEDDYIDREKAASMQQQALVKALCLHVSHDCNLRCKYCFASTGDFGTGHRMTMDFETAKRAIDFVIAKSGHRRNIEVDFFGGEPLMNWEVVKELVRYGRSLEAPHHKRFRFTLTTNGVNVDDDVIEFSNREMQNVVMSIDGRKEVHDRFRVDYQGRGSYDTIIPKFQEFARRRGERDYYVRGTYTHANPDFTNDILHLADLGFTKLSMEPVVCDPSDPSALTAEDLPILFSQYEKLAEAMLARQKEGRPITFYHYMIDLNHGPCIYKRIAGCGSGTEYFAVTPQGELYPCHQFVGDEAYRMGNIWDGVTNTDMQDKFRQCNVYSRRECDDCWARLYCSGGCAANAYHASGDINGVYEYGCELFRKRMECAIMLKIAERGIS